jgi:hypothetical protein
MHVSIVQALLSSQSASVLHSFPQLLPPNTCVSHTPVALLQDLL